MRFSHVIAKLPAQDLDRARRFYSEQLGLEPEEERTGGLRYVIGESEFHVFASSGAPSGASTQMGFEVEDLEATLEELRARGVKTEHYDIPGFEIRGDVVVAPDHYASKGSAELGAFFYDSEGNLIGVSQAI